MKLKFEVVINRILNVEGVIDDRKYKRVQKRLDRLLLKESKKKFTSTLT